VAFKICFLSGYNRKKIIGGYNRKKNSECDIATRTAKSESQGVGRFLGGVGFLRALGVGFFHQTPTPEVQLNHLLNRTPKLGILTCALLLKLLLKQRILALHHDFH